MEERIKKLKEVSDVQSMDGNWDFSRYMLGLANGLILAVSIMEDTEPEFLDEPDEFLDSKMGNIHFQGEEILCQP